MLPAPTLTIALLMGNGLTDLAEEEQLLDAAVCALVPRHAWETAVRDELERQAGKGWARSEAGRRVMQALCDAGGEDGASGTGNTGGTGYRTHVIDVLRERVRHYMTHDHLLYLATGGRLGSKPTAGMVTIGGAVRRVGAGVSMLVRGEVERVRAGEIAERIAERIGVPVGAVGKVAAGK